MSRFTTELVEDGGLAASGTDFFRSVQFLEAEGATHSLLIFESESESEPVALAPLLVREIPGSDRSDGISPYGYPGLAISRGSLSRPDLPLDPVTIDFSGTGLVSIFLRHSISGGPPVNGAPSLAEATPRNVCLLSDPTLPRKSRASDRQQIRKNLNRGCSIEITPGPKTSHEQRAGFFAAYTETMTRTSAADRYFFSQQYFDLILSAESTWLFLLRTPGEGVEAGTDRPVAAASIAALSDGLLHYYLSGTADAHLKGAPMKNVIEEMIGFAAERDLAVNFGGGITPGDALEEFKRGFANREVQWFTSELICDPEAAAALTGKLSPDNDPGFFPPYRA
ncbi:MAG: GNAT family N-acetyltransferase [Solirubrobacterales bacterium]|nr:GNAT family N-acetyltransferase [Solirubrobacterales bacterium]HMT04400.1 GNAT family N-acetyltransferase [Solirubrobacterales bacterium]